MSTWGTDPEGMRAKSRADEEARKSADEARAAEEKRERIWEAIYAACIAYMSESDGPKDMEQIIDKMGINDIGL